jgi:hypothetical protein
LGLADSLVGEAEFTREIPIAAKELALRLCVGAGRDEPLIHAAYGSLILADQRPSANRRQR